MFKFHMNNRLLIFSCVCLAMIWTSCANNVEEDLYPPSTCDTTNVTYSLTVAPIINQNCSACHGGDEPTSGIPLDAYDHLKAQVDDERLLGAIRHEEGFSAMPQGAPKLSDCSILKIEKWVAEGAQNN